MARARAGGRRTALRLAVLLVLAGVVWSIGQLATARNELSAAKSELSRAQQAVRGQHTEDALAGLARADRHVARARTSVRSFPVALTRAVPVAGSPVRAVVDATRAADDAIAAGRTVAKAVDEFPTAGAAALDGHDLSAFHAAAGRSEADIRTARAQLLRADASLRGPSGAWLPQVSGAAKQLRSQVAKGRRQLERAADGLHLLREFTAPETDARLLLLSQDSLELRPTGGFIGSFGVLHFHAGTVELERYDSFEALPPPEPPMEPPMYLAGALPRFWGLSNANWWPDFPTSAGTAREMFKRQGGGEVDGVIAITEKMMSRLVGALGPFQVPGYDKPVVEEGFEDRVVYEVELKRPADEPRKKFLMLLSEQVFDKLFSLPADQVPNVAKVIEASVGEGDVQLWFADESRQAYVAGSVLSGELPKAPGGDFLMVVDANLEASKANADVAKDITYTVDRDGGRALVATVRVRVRNEGPETSINRGYHAFLRVYGPKGARLTAASEVKGDLGDAPDGPYRVFGTYVDVAPGAEDVVTFQYSLPASVLDGRDYNLTWLRQAGTQRDKVTAVVEGRSYGPRSQDRLFTVERRVFGNPVTEFLRSRAITRPLVDTGS